MRGPLGWTTSRSLKKNKAIKNGSYHFRIREFAGKNQSHLNLLIKLPPKGCLVGQFLDILLASILEWKFKSLE